jgi:HSP20 family molecular chaperone IbpA
LARAQCPRQRRPDAVWACAGASGVDRTNPGLTPFDGWVFIAADVFGDGDRVLVQVEAPGLRREDFSGSFRRDVALPVSVKPD